MAEATTGDVPSRPLRHYIDRQTRRGIGLHAEAIGFALHLGWIKERFDAEVEPLGLSHDDYAAKATECGLVGLLDVTNDIAECLSRAVAA